MSVAINKIIELTAGKNHCWCDSDVGMVRKPNNAIRGRLWDIFFNREIKKIIEPVKLRWYQKLWNWIKSLFNI